MYFIDNPTYVRKPNLLPWDLEDMAKILKAAGYTPYDKQVDNAEYGLEPPERKVENFTIPVEYRLEGASLVVRVPMEEVKYPKDVYTSDVWGLRGVHWTVVQDELLMMPRRYRRRRLSDFSAPCHQPTALFWGSQPG